MSAPDKPAYDTRVFINCPFDDAYWPLFQALVFTVEYCGFTACCALEVEDSGETRAEKIVRLIADSRYGIHDISRTELNAEYLPRFNMPFEFGVFTGFKYGGRGRQKDKVILVLDRERYRFQRFISDIAGQDIRAHGNDPEKVIREVRAWLQSQAGRRDLFGAEHIVGRYRVFTADIPDLLAGLNKTAADLANYQDFHNLVYRWIHRDTVG
ncbi:MAG TPA: hypothetical protein VD866_30900 [Urbifossiella sp.]|nr:hypothetical protein [Urbifossiella sp.]